MRALEISPRDAEALAETLADWIDSDGNRTTLGGEDDTYVNAAPPYRTAGTLLSEVSELRAIRGFTPEIYARIRPFVCALPTADLSPLNINLLDAGNAVLLTMLMDGRLDPEAAAELIESRPDGGWLTVDEFWNNPMLTETSSAGCGARSGVAAHALLQPSGRSRLRRKRSRYDIALRTPGRGTDPARRAALDAGGMMHTRLVLLSPASGQPSSYLIVDGEGEIIGRGVLAVPALAPSFKGRTVLIVPGTEVLTRWLDLEDGPTARVAEAAAVPAQGSDWCAARQHPSRFGRTRRRRRAVRCR